MYVCDKPIFSDVEISEADVIAKFTYNTWQKNRPYEEILRDTIQGKTAEIVFESFLRQNTAIELQTYDSFRNDGLKKHAPFDAIIYKRSILPAAVQKCIQQTNAEITTSDFGRISTELRKKMIENGIATVEIKSSALNKKDLQGVKLDNYRTERDYQRITQNISSRDFFVYPHFYRESDKIDNFYKYAQDVRDKAERFSDVKKDEL